MDYMKIRSLEQLKEESQEEDQGFFILLNGGIRSNKRVHWDEISTVFCITNEIDDTFQELNEGDIMSQVHTNIGYAITKGAFYKDEAVSRI